MGVWTKIWTAVRGGVNDAAESVVDSQALRILDQEIRDADIALRQAYDGRSTVAGKRKLKESELEQIKTDLDKYTSAAKTALAQGHEELARKTAERIQKLRAEATSLETVVAEYKATEEKMAAMIKQTETKIERLRREVEMVKATEAVQSAQAAVASKYAGADSKLGAAADSLARIKEKQAARAAKLESADEMEKIRTGSDLDEELAKAGIHGSVESVDDILNSLK